MQDRDRDMMRHVEVINPDVAKLSPTCAYWKTRYRPGFRSAAPCINSGSLSHSQYRGSPLNELGYTFFAPTRQRHRCNSSKWID